MKQHFMTLSAGLALFILPVSYCMEQDENAKKLALFFEIKPVYHKGQPEYESVIRTYDTRGEIVITTAARAIYLAPPKPTNMASKSVKANDQWRQDKNRNKISVALA